MIVRALHIENFRRFARVDLELPDGVTALVGRNGAGKSTLLEALGWCLYGMDATRDRDKSSLRRRGALPTADVRVRLEFELGGHAYVVTRELVGRSESPIATVTVDGSLVVSPGPQSQKEATAYVTRLFHMDSAAFFTSLVARQRELAALTDAKPAERRRILMGLLRLDALDRAIDLARERKRDASNRLEGLRAGMVDVATLVHQQESGKTVLLDVRERVAACEARIAGLETEIEARRAQRKASRQRAAEHGVLSLHVATARGRVDALVADRARMGAELEQARASATAAFALASMAAGLPVLQERIDRLRGLRARQDALAKLRVEETRAAQEVDVATARLEQARGTLAAGGPVRTMARRVEDEIVRSEEALQRAQQALADAAARVAESLRGAKDARDAVARLRALGPDTPCPTCTRPLHEHHATTLHGIGETLAAREAESAAREEARRAAAALAEAARGALDGLRGRKRELQPKLDLLVRAEADATGGESALHAASERLARIRADLAEPAPEAIDDATWAKALDELKLVRAAHEEHVRLTAEASREYVLLPAIELCDIQLAAARALHQAADAQIVALAFEPKAHEDVERATAESESRLADARVERERLHGEKARLLDAQRALVERIERQTELRQQADALERTLALFEQLSGRAGGGLLPEFKDHLIGRIRPLLTAHAGRLYREMTDGRYADLEVADDYDLLVHDDGKAFGLGRFSGGESDLANLCLRLAVSQVVAERAGTAGFGFLALDEVFGSQDEGRKANILRALQALSGSFRQIVLITHVDDVKDAVEHVLRVTENEDGTSRVVLES